MIQRLSSSHASPVRGSPLFTEEIASLEGVALSCPVILLALENTTLQSTLETHLCAEGYHIVLVGDGEHVLRIAENTHLSLVLLDLKLPQRDGLDLCRVLRTQRHTAHVPIVLLASSYDEAEVIIGLEVGADEYIPLPCHWPMLRVRIRALLRRSNYMQQGQIEGEEPEPEKRQQHASEQVVIQGDLCIHLAGHKVTLKGQPIELSARLFRLLVYFVQHQGKVLTRRQLMEQVQDEKRPLGDERVMDAYVHGLREKLEDDPAHPHYIQTLRGIGYRFTP